MASTTPVLGFLLDKLVATMDQQFLLYRNILDTSRRKQALLLASKRGGGAEAVEKEMAELAGLTTTEENLIRQAESLERERQALAMDLAVQLGAQPRPESVTLRALVDALREAVKNQGGDGLRGSDGRRSGDALIEGKLQRLQELHHGLVELLAEIRQVNELNGTLLRQSLAYIDFSINLLTGAADAASYDYGAVLSGSGKQDVAGRKGVSANRKPVILDVRA